MADKHNDEVAKNRLPLDLNRRKFLKRVGFIGAGVTTLDLILQQADEPVDATQLNASQTAETMQLQRETNTLAATSSTGEIPRRKLGSTGVEVSAIGLGGSDLGKAPSLEEATRIVHEAIDAGITFMDNAWEYNNHRSEEWMGRALQGRRDKAFLMTKVCTHGRDRCGGDAATRRVFAAAPNRSYRPVADPRSCLLQRSRSNFPPRGSHRSSRSG